MHEKLRIPEASDSEAIFGAVPAAPAAGNSPPAPSTAPDGAQAALKAELPAASPDAADLLTPALAEQADAQVARWVAEIEGMLASADSLEQFREQLLARYGDLPAGDLVTVMATALSAIELRGRADVLAAQ